MSKYISLDDFKDEEGTLDWKAYKKAEIENGQICYQCNDHIIFGAGGHRRLCGSCSRLTDDKEEVRHDSRIRCPKCKYSWNPWESEDYPSEGQEDMEVTCGECDHEFEVGVITSYTFTSPELDLDPEEPEEDEEEESEDE
jgi:ssDNA-binding Zn-finger/Zn-ribbon topoisomerase 1